MGWSAPRVGRNDNHAKSASAHVPCGRSAGSPQVEVRSSRAAQESQAISKKLRNRIRRPVALSVQKSLGTWRGMERLALAAKTTTPSPTARAYSVSGWLILYWVKRAGGRPTQFKGFGYGLLKPQPTTWCGVGEEDPRPTAWAGARPALTAKTTTPSPPARACSVDGLPNSPRGEAHGGRVARVLKAIAMTL